MRFSCGMIWWRMSGSVGILRSVDILARLSLTQMTGMSGGSHIVTTCAT